MSDRILRKLFSWQEAWISCRELFLARIVHDDDDDRRRGGGRSSSNRRNTESSQRRFGYSVIRFAKEDESEGSSRRDRSNGDNYLDLKERRSPFVDFELSVFEIPVHDIQSLNDTQHEMNIIHMTTRKSVSNLYDPIKTCDRENFFQ
ncbi:uncharacterized protein LOC117611814 isoform X4 [Osmia lignaria lignaria]|uniref:uncharacterized protein LOC117611814 isoform X4 n=1 Tax=Osmia lignaria lignaria TaxID=1437193 RepID=UPI00402B5483